MRSLAIGLAVGVALGVPGQQRAVDAWPMFRGSPSLSGISTVPLPSPLKLRWSYQAKDSIESSAAIVDGVVYVGSADGFLHAVDLATGQLRWQYRGEGRHRGILALRAWRRGLRRRSGRGRSCGRRGVRQRALDLQGRGRDQIVAQRGGRPSLHRILRPEPLLPGGIDRRDHLDLQDRRPRARHTGVRQRDRLHLRVRRNLQGHRCGNGQADLCAAARRLHGRLGRDSG